MQSNHEVTDLIIKIAHVMSPMLVTIMPIISIDSALLSCCTFRASRIPSPLELINEPMYKNSLTYNTKNQQYSLSDLEHAILFLLGIGLKQREVGKFLGYTRGYIASIIAYRLCPAFGVIDGSSLRLIEIARGVIWSNQHVPQLVADKLLPVLL